MLPYYLRYSIYMQVLAERLMLPVTANAESVIFSFAADSVRFSKSAFGSCNDINDKILHRYDVDDVTAFVLKREVLTYSVLVFNHHNVHGRTKSLILHFQPYKQIYWFHQSACSKNHSTHLSAVQAFQFLQTDFFPYLLKVH